MSDIEIRFATSADIPEVLGVLQHAMSRADDERFAALFRWKHVDNAFGESPAWVAVDGDRIVAVRYLMRWEFELDGGIKRAARAVDTATLPEYQGKGLFKKLTLSAIDSLSADGTDFIFNTPNDQSRPGYLKMGWQLVGVVPVPSRPLSPIGVLKMARARVPADHFSRPTTCGEPAIDVLSDGAGVADLLAARGRSTRLRTRLDLAVMRWRYGGRLIEYRAISNKDGMALFRIRNRGQARELALALIVVRADRGAEDSGAAQRLARAVLRAARREADYAVAIGDRPLASFIPVPRAGPTLVWRAVNDPVFMSQDRWQLSLGDIELF